jgi:hypothetical protein
MKKVAAEPYRDIDFSKAKRGAVFPLEPGKIDAVPQVVREELKAPRTASRQAKPRAVSA